jgi:hypothetical protein
MIDCALVDRDSSQIDCKPPENAGAGSDDRTRKRARGEAPEDYAKRDAFKAVRGTRERLQSAPTASITAHFFSIVYYALINVTRELALKPIYTNAPRVYVFGPHAASDDELRARIELYDRGVDPELFVNLRNPLCWLPYNDQYLVCPSVGEVLSLCSLSLCGNLRNSKITVHAGDVHVERSHMVLLACRQYPRPGETADHKNPEQPLNDSRPNLSWKETVPQRFNQRQTALKGQRMHSNACHYSVFKDGKPVSNHISQKELAKHYRVSQSVVSEAVNYGRRFLGVYSISVDGRRLLSGSLLCQHPTLFNNVQCSSDGMISTCNQGVWQSWRHPKISGDKRRTTTIMGRVISYHTLFMECLLKRLLAGDETVDHIDGNWFDNSIINLQVTTSRSNSEKSVVKLVTSTLNHDSVVWGGLTHASQELGLHKSSICYAVSGRYKSAGGYSWRDSTVEEVEHFFRAMDALEDLPAAVASLASHPRHGELVRALELRREREAALARLGLCDPPVGWVRGTDASSGLSFYHREETGECRWRNPTLTRLGL